MDFRSRTQARILKQKHFKPKLSKHSRIPSFSIQHANFFINDEIKSVSFKAKRSLTSRSTKLPKLKFPRICRNGITKLTKD